MTKERLLESTEGQLISSILQLTKNGEIKWKLPQPTDFFQGATAEYNGVQFSVYDEQDSGGELFVKANDGTTAIFGYHGAAVVLRLVRELAENDQVLVKKKAKLLRQHEQTQKREAQIRLQVITKINKLISQTTSEN